MIMWNQIKHQLFANPLHLIVGTVMALIGLELWLSKTYFFWPPQAIFLLNDDIVGFSCFLIGTGLIIWSASPRKTAQVNKILLMLASMFMTLLTVIEFGHAIFMNHPRIFSNVFADAGLIAIIWYIARHSDTQ
nr:MAG TPA: hypothetical protein [Caudoviricetes sp.]